MATRHLLGISGGKDSAALAVYMSTYHPEIDCEYFFTDTGKELPEVYEFLGKLEAFLGKPILYLNQANRNFDYYLKLNGYFLPSPSTRWCTRCMKLKPFQEWIKPMLEAGDVIYSYVAIRADEPERMAMQTHHKNLHVVLPFKEAGIDKEGVYSILDDAGIGLPKYYEWRSRSGCTFCFFQQKIEWLNLYEHHPDKFKEAMDYEKTAVANGSRFTWSEGESLADLIKPERAKKIREDFEKRKVRELAKRPVNSLREGLSIIDIDDIYGCDEGNGSCTICTK